MSLGKTITLPQAKLTGFQVCIRKMETLGRRRMFFKKLFLFFIFTAMH